VYRLLTSVAVFALAALTVLADDRPPPGAPKDTPKAAATRKKLQQKVSLSFKDTRLADVVDELKEEAKVSFLLDTKGGVSQNQTITYTGKDVTLAEALDKMFAKNGLGYVVISGNNAYDGSVMIKQGKERGYPLGDRK
jgi:autotransporter-associated beta strand protein